MILDIGTLMYNMTTGGKGGTPSWGTDMGQGEGYKFNFENFEEMVTSLTYSCVDDMENVKLEFGKGGSRTDDYKLITASLYKKIYVNDEIIPDAKFMLVLAKQIHNESGNHIGRRTLKYTPNLKYHDIKINENCINKIKEQFGLNDNSAWFINEINLKNQDELHFSMYIVDKEKSKDFENAEKRKEYVLEITGSTSMINDRKIEYAEWLKNVKELADETITKYVGYIKNIKDRGFATIDLYSIDNKEALQHEVSKFISTPEYIEYNNSSHRIAQSTLNSYSEFLEYKDNLIIRGYNKIYYGAPGTGKSYEIDNVVLKDLSKKEKEERVIRITFHPEYTYSDFIGQLIPIIEKDSDGNDKITYDFKIGPFTLALKKAYETKKMIYLVIEEMSRGNCAAIFGDIFQLLDRNKDGESTYDITNDIIAEKVFGNKDVKIKIPTNLTILGTVNTSDQNVYVMDTAFKRRFEWKYIPITPAPEEDESMGYKNNAEIELKNSDEVRKYKWIDFYMALNKFIASNEYLGLGEDKQIGQFFIKFDFEEAKDREKIENKLLHYLWFDIQESSFKSDKKLFAEKISDFGDLFIKYNTNEQIFSDEFFKLINDYRWEK